MRLLTSLFLLFVGTQHVAQAQTVIATCGASVGKSYFREGNSGKWVDDGVTGGSITLIFDKDKNPDLIIKSRGGSFSAKGDGATVVVTHFSADTIGIVAAYPLQTVESYMFKIKSGEQGYVLWTSTRSNEYMTTTKAMFAECN